MHPLLLLLALFSTLVTPLGINCRGSSECSDVAIFHYGSTYNLLNDFYDVLTYGNGTIPGGPANPEVFYRPHVNLLCNHNKNGVGSICLFLQGKNVPDIGVSGVALRFLLAELIDHGCNLCGSVPISGDNDPDKMGILTVNYVTYGACQGFCAGSIFEGH